MPQHLAYVALVVADYDEAIAYYTQCLGFELVEDTPISTEKRWVLIAPPGGHARGGCLILLARAATDEQRTRVGNQTGGRVGFFLYTDDFTHDYARLLSAGVRIVREPSQEPYGTVAVFADLYGNLWDLIEPNRSTAR